MFNKPPRGQWFWRISLEGGICRSSVGRAFAGLLLASASGPAIASEELRELSQDDAQWVMPAKNYASTRFSGLDQITTANVAELEPVWSFSTGLTAGHEAVPLVIGETMYVVTPWPNILYALDVEDGSLKWSYNPGTERAAQGVACCDVVNRRRILQGQNLFQYARQPYGCRGRR